MINLRNENQLALAISKAEMYALRTKDFLPYPDVEVEEAVRVMANWMGLKSPRPKILWLGKATQKDLKVPKKMMSGDGETELTRRSARYYEGLRAVHNRLGSISSDISDEFFGYYTPKDKKAPDELKDALNVSKLGWGRRRLDTLINRSGTIRSKFKRVVGERASSHQSNWSIPTHFYATSADRIREFGRFNRVFVLGEHFVDKRKGDQNLIKACEKIYVSLYSILAYEGNLLLVERPRLYENERGFHREGGYAIEFPKMKVGVYGRNGVRVTKELVTKSAEELSAEIITKTTNAEVRREAVDKIGIERVLEELACEVLDETPDGKYQLVNLDLGDTDRWSSSRRRRPFLKMLNPSTGDWHVEGVAPHIQTVSAALAWRNGVEEGAIPQALT